MCYWFPKCRPTFPTGSCLVLPTLPLTACSCNLVIVPLHNLHLCFGNMKPSIPLTECYHCFFGCNIHRTRQMHIMQQPGLFMQQIISSFSYNQTPCKLKIILPKLFTMYADHQVKQYIRLLFSKIQSEVLNRLSRHLLSNHNPCSIRFRHEA